MLAAASPAGGAGKGEPHTHPPPPADVSAAAPAQEAAPEVGDDQLLLHQERLQPAKASSSQPSGSWDAIRAELGRLATLGLPLSATNLLSYSNSVVTLAFVGHLGPLAMSQAVLGGSFFNVTGLSLLIGLASAMETLAGQAYGARNYPLVGVVMQRAMLVSGLLLLVVYGIWTQVEGLLLLLGQSPQIAAGAARYIHLSMPAIAFAGLSECMKRYLQVQNEVGAITLSVCVMAGLGPLASWLLIWRLGLGLDGAAIALDLTNATGAALLWAAVAHRDRRLRGTPRQTWHGWSREAWQNVWPYLKLALPSTAMVCMEWWTFEVMIVLAGLLAQPDVSVAVMGICFQTASWLYMLPLGFGSSASVRVSNELGANRPQAARLAAWVALGAMWLVMGTMAVAMVACRATVARLFSRDPAVLALATSVLPILGISAMGDATNAVLSGVVRGCGRQVVGMVVNVSTYWLLGVPLAAALAFKAGMGVAGLWWGLAIITLVAGSAMLVVMARFDWAMEAKRAAALLQLNSVKVSASSSGSGDGDDLEMAGLLPAV